MLKPLQLLTCNLCRKNVSNSDALALHYAQHFAPNECRQCNRQIISIGDRLFHLQLVNECVKSDQLCVKCEQDAPTASIITEEVIKVELEDDELDACDDNDDGACDDSNDYSTNAAWNDDSNDPSDASFPSPIQGENLPLASPVIEPSLDDFTWNAYPDESDTDHTTEPLEIETMKRRRPPAKLPKSKNTNRRKYECFICRQSLNELMQLKLHIQAHDGIRPKCHICGKCFVNANNLKCHMRLHLGIKNHVCSYCGKTFAHKANLISHVTMHTGEKSHKCGTCGRMFARLSNLHQHQRVHSGKKPYKCNIEGCDRAYMFKVDWKRHLYGAHRIYTKKFECKMCGKILPENKLLVEHMKTHLPK